MPIDTPLIRMSFSHTLIKLALFQLLCPHDTLAFQIGFYPSTTSSFASVVLYSTWNQDPMRYDMSVTFGSGDPDDFGTEEDEFRTDQAARKAVIQSLLLQQDVDFKEERRRKKWGKFANVTSQKDIQALEEEERQKIAEGES
jgi:hypothetical protein